MTQIGPGTAFELIRRLISAADQYKADALVALCPMCQMNIDAYQAEMNRHFKTSYHVPILFFTLIAGWRYGAKVGLLTGLLSPLANHFLTGLPPAALLRELLVQSALLGVVAALVAARSRRPTLALLALVVGVHQALVLFPQLLQGGAQACFETFQLRLPGLLLQILAGTALLRCLPTRPQSLDGSRVG